MNIQSWSPLGCTVWSPCSPRDSQESSPTPQFKSISSSDSLLISIFSQYCCLCLFFLITLARIFRTMLSRNNESRHPCLIPHLRGKAFCLLPFKHDINCFLGFFFFCIIYKKEKVFISKYFPFWYFLCIMGYLDVYLISKYLGIFQIFLLLVVSQLITLWA